MTNREKIEFLYKGDGIRDKQFLNDLIHDDFKLEWDSSSGNSILDKNFILNLSEVINLNFEISYFEISHLVEEDNQIYNTAGIEVKPDFPGGIQKFYQYVGKNFRVPEEDGIKGKIIVQFVVERDGSITDVKANGPNKDFNEEAIRTVKTIKNVSTAAEVMTKAFL